jgi:hypothetical protein
MELKRKVFHLDMENSSIVEHLQIREVATWINMHGTARFIKDMDTNYIRNCVIKIKRGGFNDDKSHYLVNLENELNYRQILKDEARRNSV